MLWNNFFWLVFLLVIGGLGFFLVSSFFSDVVDARAEWSVNAVCEPVNVSFYRFYRDVPVYYADMDCGGLAFENGTIFVARGLDWVYEHRILNHEFCHVEQFKRGLGLNPSFGEERECNYAEWNFFNWFKS